MTFCCIWPATQIKKTSSSIKLELIFCFVILKGIILQHFAFCPPVHYILPIEHRFKTLVSIGKHIYDEQGNRSWNGMLFSSKKALLLNLINYRMSRGAKQLTTWPKRQSWRVLR
jgi:hypothetical protein